MLGIVKIAWSDPNRVGRNIPDRETIYTICFDPLYSCPDETANPISVLIDPSQAAFFEVVNSVNQTTPLDFDFSNGSLALDCGGPGALRFNADNIVQPRCSGDSNGSITVDFLIVTVLRV